MSIIGNMTLQSDENGLVTLQCDRCRSRFKMESDYLNNELEGEICCPVCGISEKANTFYPEEVVEEAGKMAIMEAEEIIQRAFKGMNSKNIQVKTKPVVQGNRDIVFKDRDYNMQVVSVHCCQKKIALLPVDIAAGYYCPYCGRIAK